VSPANESEIMLAYHERAEEVVARISRQWERGAQPDAKALTDAVHRALVEEANLELRQVLAQMGGQVEMALARAGRGQAAMTPDKLRGLLESVNRASAILEVFLDRSSAAKLTIRLEPEPFDLGDAMDDVLRAHGIHERVQLALGPAPVLADRAKIMDALGHLVTRFYFAARPREQVVVSLGLKGGTEHVEGFVGLAPSHLSTSQLMEEMHMPLHVEDVGIEVAYIRAVLERHGGSLFVATAGESSAGFGFTVPTRKEEMQ
jgi:light-regulated signal transduction histidine kinase (bacteriophytochrome)